LLGVYAPWGLSRKFFTMTRKFNSENYNLNTQRHRDREIFEHGKHEGHEMLMA
jgi:hypothetical protein